MTPPATPRQRILVADDDTIVLRMTCARLKHEGYDVVTASDGEEAIKKMASLPVHLVLVDVRMPRLSGYEVCRALRHNPKTAAVPVIVFTAWDTLFQQMAERCIEVGATDWIRKPFRTEELMEKIHRALGEGGCRNE